MIVLDIHRILARLRSQHAKTRKSAGKPALITQLHEAINDRSVKARTELTKNLKDGTQALQDLFSKLEAISNVNSNIAEAHEVIGEIVRQAHELTVASNIREALQNSKLEPNLKKHLTEAIGKLGRYYSAASELVCAARDRKCRVFQNIRVEPFQIKKPASSSKSPWKIHAEIQLLFFYELYLAVHDQESFALARVLVICAISSSISTVLSTSLGPTEGYMTSGHYQTG